MLAVSQAVAEVGCVEDVVHPLQDLFSCRELFRLLDVLIFKLCGFQDDTAFRIQAPRSSKAKNPADQTAISPCSTLSLGQAGLATVDASKINLDEVALVPERSCDSLEADGEGGSYPKVRQQIAQWSLL